jgi:hypothetical protein
MYRYGLGAAAAKTKNRQDFLQLMMPAAKIVQT